MEGIGVSRCSPDRLTNCEVDITDWNNSGRAPLIHLALLSPDNHPGIIADGSDSRSQPLSEGRNTYGAGAVFWLLIIPSVLTLVGRNLSHELLLLPESISPGESLSTVYDNLF